jgi:hypothetical protein
VLRGCGSGSRSRFQRSRGPTCFVSFDLRVADRSTPLLRILRTPSEHAIEQAEPGFRDHWNMTDGECQRANGAIIDARGLVTIAGSGGWHAARRAIADAMTSHCAVREAEQAGAPRVWRSAGSLRTLRSMTEYMCASPGSLVGVLVGLPGGVGRLVPLRTLCARFMGRRIPAGAPTGRRGLDATGTISDFEQPMTPATAWPGSMARPGVRAGCSPAGLLEALAPLLP